MKERQVSRRVEKEYFNEYLIMTPWIGEKSPLIII